MRGRATHIQPGKRQGAHRRRATPGSVGERLIRLAVVPEIRPRGIGHERQTMSGIVDLRTETGMAESTRFTGPG